MLSQLFFRTLNVSLKWYLKKKEFSTQSILPKRFNSDFAKKINNQDTNPSQKQQLQKFKDEMIGNQQKIDEINRYFLGIKINTDYFKNYREQNYAKICKIVSNKYQINDLPFSIGKNSLQIEMKPDSFKQNLAVKIILSKINLQTIRKHILTMAIQYIQNLFNGQRSVNIEPNFEMQNIIIMNSLRKLGYSFTMQRQDIEPSIVLTNITLYKGLSVIRNNNYELNAYEISDDNQHQGIIQYSLHKKEHEVYPEIQWYSKKSILLRLEAKIYHNTNIIVQKDHQMIGQTKNIENDIIIEADLIRPPPLAFVKLSPEEYLNSYRLNIKEFTITNYNNKNTYYPFTYQRIIKTHKLINKLV